MRNSHDQEAEEEGQGSAGVHLSQVPERYEGSNPRTGAGVRIGREGGR